MVLEILQATGTAWQSLEWLEVYGASVDLRWQQIDVSPGDRGGLVRSTRCQSQVCTVFGWGL